MKKCTLTLLCGLFVCHAAFAQTQLPNANFEDWTTADNGKDSLTGWSSSNAVTISPVIPMKKDADAYQGSYAAKLITAPFGFVSYTKISILVNGAAIFDWNGGGGYHVEYVSGGGTPISIKPTELKGYYKSINNARVDVLLTQYNTTLQKRDTVSFSSNILTGNASYSQFTVALPDLMPAVTPDTITTFFYSTNPDPTPPNGIFADLYLDSLTLTEPAPAPAPAADFSASPLGGTMDSIVQFTDMSTESPTSWVWTITPNTVTYLSGSTETSQNPTVQFTAAGDYTVKLVVSNASGSDSITKTDYIHIIDSGVGIHEIKGGNDLLVYPNPAKDRLFLSSSTLGSDLQIIDIDGRIISTSKKIACSYIDISTLNTGLYFIKLTKGGQTSTFKLWVEQ